MNHTHDTPSQWIKRFAHLAAPGGHVLDVACGAGRHSRLFLERGHRVTAIDHDPEVFCDSRRYEKLDFIAMDLESGQPWPFARRSFDVVVVTNYLHRPLLPLLVESVGEGGLFLYETFAVGNEAFGRPKNPDFLLEAGELLTAVQGELQVVAYEHGITRHGAARVGQRICAMRRQAAVTVRDFR
jgi:SAM-dependent methyltransferase